MPENTSSSSALVGCVLDVSGSMRAALEPGGSNDDATDRLSAVIRAALKVAQAEERHDPGAFIFIGVFGLDTNVADTQGWGAKGHTSPSAVDLCSIADALLGDSDENASGHSLLIERANKENLSHITEYVREKLTNDEARIVHAHLERHPDQLQQFINAIPTKERMDNVHSAGVRHGARISGETGSLFGAAMGSFAGSFGRNLGAKVGSSIGTKIGEVVGGAIADEVKDYAVENSEALNLARRICVQWLNDFAEFKPRPVQDVIRILDRLQKRSGTRNNDSTELAILKRYMYGGTAMREVLRRSLDVFRASSKFKHRVLLLVSDGYSTDGDPLDIVNELRRERVSISTVYLTSDHEVTHRQLHYQPANDWDNGQRTLFLMAGKVSGVRHPIPVLASMGWEIPSQGEVGLHAVVSSVVVLGEFCSLMLSARFGTADAWLDVVGRISQDAFVNDQYVQRCRNPSNQADSATCYAHAAAGVIHMALLRIVSREGGYPSIQEIREKVLAEFPPEQGVRDMAAVLEAARRWYRPLRFRKVDEDGARQAVLRRRPVLAGFYLSDLGWDMFGMHFARNPSNHTNDPIPVLTRAQMAPQRALVPDNNGGGHAVVMTGCTPHSLTFLNSWGSNWGNGGSFSIEGPAALELEGPWGRYPMSFYDVFWLENELTHAERQAYSSNVDERLRVHSAQYPSILELELRCPDCRANAPLIRYNGNTQQVRCPRCQQSFTPEPGYIMEALCTQRGNN